MPIEDKAVIYIIIAQFSYGVKLLQFLVSLQGALRRSNLQKHPATEIATPSARNDREKRRLCVTNVLDEYQELTVSLKLWYTFILASGNSAYD